jgi:hypothetical protein
MSKSTSLEETRVIDEELVGESDVATSAPSQFRKELETLINSTSRESGSDTPDYVLADFLDGCLIAFDAAVKRRDRYYGITANGTGATIRSDDSAAETETQALIDDQDGNGCPKAHYR